MEKEFLTPGNSDRAVVQSSAVGGWPGPFSLAAGLFVAALMVTVLSVDLPNLDPRSVTAETEVDGGKLAAVAAGGPVPEPARKRRDNGGFADIVAWLDRTIADAD